MHKIIREDLEFIISAKLPWEKLEGKNILVTGASGFIPAYMVETVLFLNDHKFKKKAKIFALGRNRGRLKKRFSNYAGRKDLEFIIQDVSVPVKCAAKFDYIIHAASQASPKCFGSDPCGTIAANTLGTAGLLKRAVKDKTESFLFFSAGEVYGELSKKSLIKENEFGSLDPLCLRSCYAEGKRAGENMCISWNHQYGTVVKIVRPFHTYGPGMRLDDGRVFADFVSDIIAGRDIRLKSDGKAVRSFCYLADATAGFFTVLLKGKTGAAYNVGNENNTVSIIGLASKLARLFPNRKIKVGRNQKQSQKGYIRSNFSHICPDTTKLRALGWRPEYSLKEGFRRTIKSYL